MAVRVWLVGSPDLAKGEFGAQRSARQFDQNYRLALPCENEYSPKCATASGFSYWDLFLTKLRIKNEHQ
jgi:hypothetical protein